ncbi:MAG TPA: hypothetical protein PL128_04420, partial [Ginsengibacter sp.]|nr:hypothetical protein [Ginsengibacter sp.]
MRQLNVSRNQEEHYRGNKWTFSTIRYFKFTDSGSTNRQRIRKSGTHYNHQATSPIPQRRDKR